MRDMLGLMARESGVGGLTPNVATTPEYQDAMSKRLGPFPPLLFSWLSLDVLEVMHQDAEKS